MHKSTFILTWFISTFRPFLHHSYHSINNTTQWRQSKPTPNEISTKKKPDISPERNIGMLQRSEKAVKETAWCVSDMGIQNAIHEYQDIDREANQGEIL